MLKDRKDKIVERRIVVLGFPVVETRGQTAAMRTEHTHILNLLGRSKVALLGGKMVEEKTT